MRRRQCDGCAHEGDHGAWREITSEGGITFDVCFMCATKNLVDLEALCIENLLDRFGNSTEKVEAYMEREGRRLGQSQIGELRRHLTRLSFRKNHKSSVEGEQ